MPRAALSTVSLKQLVAELERRRGRLVSLLAQREEINKEIATLEALGIGPVAEQAPVAAARRGRPPGKRGRKPGAKRATGKTLAEYVKETLAGATKGLSITEIEQRILSSDYPTKAKRLYKQIMLVLGKGGFKRVERGVYALAGAARQAGKAAIDAAVRAVATTPVKGRARSKRGEFPETGEQFILGLAKGKGKTSTAISEAWAASGRKGTPNVLLSKLSKAGKLHREKLAEGRGSTYTQA
jgi:hypothetical protein